MARLFPFRGAELILKGFSLVGILVLGCVLGAAIMFFQLPSGEFLAKAFAGAAAWYQRGRSSLPSHPRDVAESGVHEVTVDDAQKTSDGFTLYSTTGGAWATLIDMRGTVVHRWELPFSHAWPHPPHVANPLADNQIHWFRCHLYPNGDLLAIYHADGDTPYGYGLVKMDKDSKLLWAYPGRVHHDLDVGEDGTIYTLVQKLESKPPPGLGFAAAHYIADFLVVLSPEGQELESIPLVDAFVNSPYALTLFSSNKFLNPLLNRGGANASPPSKSPPQPTLTGDLLHTNSVKVLNRASAAKFPLFKAGQVLLSLRNLETLAVVDRSTRSVVWSAQGIWHLQHDAEFLDNGHLLLYDNRGSMKGTRILEYDPLTQAIPWVYANDDSMFFFAFFRGNKQRLSNGNTLILDPDNRRLFEVTRDKDLVWESFCPLPSVPQAQAPGSYPLTGARRYGADELTFLKGVARARP
ncbi:MAG TPA: arylsulfotransferase family protein [Gemmataceae bacterium]